MLASKYASMYFMRASARVSMLSGVRARVDSSVRAHVDKV